jgi:hypothetical protein
VLDGPGVQGCYEERYRLTGSGAVGLAAGLLSIGLGLLWQTPVIFAVIAVLLAAHAFHGADISGAARRLVAFRENPVDVTKILQASKARGHQIFTGKLIRKQLSLPDRAMASAIRAQEGDFRN